MSLIRPASGTATPGLDQTGEQELQTDIMRFLAILALCLMAVFALVQSLPQPEVAVGAEAGAELETRTEALRAELQRLARERELARSELETLHRDQTLADAALNRHQTVLKTAESRLRRTGERLAALERDMRGRNRDLDALSRRRQARARELAVIESRLSAARAELAAARKPEPAPVTPHPQRSSAAAHDAEPAPAARRGSAAATPSEGYSLRFASEQALRQLIGTDGVRFYALRDGQFWRLESHSGGERFGVVQAPSAYYEMTGDTVPDTFRQALVRATGSAPGAGTRWGVTLPESIVAAIRKLMHTHASGLLIIGADGHVGMQRGEPS